MKHITVIGATGKLGILTVKRLIENGISVTAIVRDTKKAKVILPTEVTLIEGNLEDVDSLKRALKNTEYLYLNLSAPDPYADLYPKLMV